MKKSELLRHINFGNSVAEQEVEVLKECFVYTRSWDRLANGDVDVIYGAKGAGKSALYTLLTERESGLFEEGTILISAENPRGSTVFSDLQTAPPASELHFVSLWKLYVLTVVGQYLQNYFGDDIDTKKVTESLQGSGLLESTASLKTLFAKVGRYIARWFNPESMEPNFAISDVGTLESVGFKITFRDPDDDQKRLGVATVDELLLAADRVVRRSGFKIWILFDRLDIAFADSADLEKNALRALFKTYLDFQAFEVLKIKLFVRTDIWQRISKEGFREATHVKRELTIEWQRDTFLNLIIRRFLYNSNVCVFYSVDKETVLRDIAQQEMLFYRIFPRKIDSGKNPDTLEWIIGRTADGGGLSAPRDIINLINSAIDLQSRRLEVSEVSRSDESLFDRSAVKEALSHASVEKVNKHLFAEYAQHR